MDKEIMKNKNIASGIAILMLLLAIPSGAWPYGYYILLRWVVTGVAVFVWWIASELERKGWSWVMIGIAILFNPLIPIHLDKETWIVIDFIIAALFLISVFKIKPRE